jgi:hypothetical protein
MLTIVSELFLTDSFLIKGEIERKYARLSQVLDEHRRYFLKIRNATLVDLNTCDRIATPILHVNLDEVLLAHEFLDSANDPNQAELYKHQRYNKVRVFFTGHLNLEVGGEVRPDLRLLGKLPYMIVNKTRLSYIYDFNE